MSLEAMAAAHVQRIEAFLDDEREALLAVRVAKGGEWIGAKLLSRIERRESRSLVVLGVSSAYTSEAAFFAAAAETVAADAARAEAQLEEADLSIAAVEPFHSREGAPPGAIAGAFADWMERLARRLSPELEKLVVLLAPREVADPESFSRSLYVLAAATASPAVKYIVLDRAQGATVAATSVARPRVATTTRLDPSSPQEVFASAARRMVVRPRQGGWSAERLRAALRPALFVEHTGPLHDRWTFFADLEDAAYRAASAGGRAAAPPPLPPRAGLPARFAEYVEALAGAVTEGGTALVWIEITDARFPLADHVLRDLARAASSARVRYVVCIDGDAKGAALPPATIAAHAIGFDFGAAMAGYEQAIANPNLAPPERVRALSMLSALVAGQPKRFSGDDRRRAIDLATQAVELSRSIEAPLDRAMALTTLGNVLLLDKQSSAARDAYANATRVALKANNLPLAAQTLGQVGIAHAQMGEWEQAVQSFNAAAQAFGKVANPFGEAQMLLWRGDAERRRGGLEAAARAYLDVLARVEKMPVHAGEAAQGLAAQAHERLAGLFELGGDAAKARAHRQTARELGGDGTLLEAF
jgi:tetratricopeptide (TPR) repeat protein